MTDEGFDSKRLLLIVPVSTAVTTIWVVTAVRFALYGDAQGFLIATGPFSLLCGYLFGISFPRREQ